MTDAMQVECPKCGAEKGARCRTLTTGRTTDSHGARHAVSRANWVVAVRARQAKRAEDRDKQAGIKVKCYSFKHELKWCDRCGDGICPCDEGNEMGRNLCYWCKDWA